MNLLPKSKEEFSEKEYWDLFFKKLAGKAFEWYGEYPELSGYLHKYMKIEDNILIVGCGNSTLGKDLYDIGHHKVTNIDISKVVIRQMESQNDKQRPGLKYIHMDALDMSFDNEQFSVVIDKGTLDALMPDSCEKTINKINQYFSEILQVMRNGGRYICISLLQEHILQTLLAYFPQNNCMFRVIRCFEPEQKSVENGENPMPVFMVICTKLKLLPHPILEVNLGNPQENTYKYDSIQKVASAISDVQKASFLCSHLKKTSLIDENEISFELHLPGSNESRFTVYVVDIIVEHKNSPYAAFIVPVGRESEWLFSTKAGRKHLANMTNNNRLAIITMHRGQEYKSLDYIQEELSEIICNLAPIGTRGRKIAFLSLGPDVGKREIKFEGSSEHSGKYVIEDVETETGDKFRRLYYLSSQLVIQSEARLKTVRSRKGKAHDIVDLAYLTCRHHIYMSLSSHMACVNRNNPKLVVLGLGGGGLCSFLHKFIPDASITGIDIDEDMAKIATNWFSFSQNDKLHAKIQDGLEYLTELESKKQKLNALLYDLDSKDTNIGMSCPPSEFLEPKTLKTVSNIISKEGVFVVNVVLRDSSLRPSIINKLKDYFKSTLSYKLEEDLNEIIVCVNFNINDSLTDKLKLSCEAFNNFLKKNNVKCTKLDIREYLDALRINS